MAGLGVTFALACVAGVLGVLALTSATRAYNDGHNAGDPLTTHYAHCSFDGHHTRRQYADYSESTLNIVTRYGPELTLQYKQLYLDAASWWNVQSTKVLIGQTLTGFNYWRTYNTNDGLNGYTQTSCTHYPGLHETVSSSIYLNRFYLDADSAAERLNTAVHEMGHQIGLGHSLQTNAQGAPIGVMWPTRIAINTPQVDDVCGVNAVYRSNTFPIGGNCHGNHYFNPP